MERRTIIVLIGLFELCTGQDVKKATEEINRRDLAYIESFVLENVRMPIMNLAESQAKRQCAIMDSQSEKVEHMEQELSALKNKLETLQQTFIEQSAGNVSSPQSDFTEIGNLRSEIIEVNKKLYMLMGRMIEVQDRQSSQERLLQQLISDVNTKEISSQRKFDVLTRNVNALNIEVDKLKEKPSTATGKLVLYLQYNISKATGSLNLFPL